MNEGQYEESKEGKAQAEAGDAAGLSGHGDTFAVGNGRIPEGITRNNDVKVSAIRRNGRIHIGCDVSGGERGHAANGWNIWRWSVNIVDGRIRYGAPGQGDTAGRARVRSNWCKLNRIGNIDSDVFTIRNAAIRKIISSDNRVKVRPVKEQDIIGMVIFRKEKRID